MQYNFKGLNKYVMFDSAVSILDTGKYFLKDVTLQKYTPGTVKNVWISKTVY